MSALMQALETVNNLKTGAGNAWAVQNSEKPAPKSWNTCTNERLANRGAVPLVGSDTPQNKTHQSLEKQSQLTSK